MGDVGCLHAQAACKSVTGRLGLQHRNVDDVGRWEVLRQMLAQVLVSVLVDGGVLAVVKLIVGQGIEGNVAAAQGFEAEQSVVDAAQATAGHQNHRIAFGFDVVDEEQVFCHRHHQAACAFYQNGVKLLLQLRYRAFYRDKVNCALGQAAGQMGRARVGKQLRHGQLLFVHRQEAAAHDGAVFGDVFGHAHIACLDGLVGNHAQALGGGGFGDVACGHGFADVGVYAADEKCAGYHKIFFLAMR